MKLWSTSTRPQLSSFAFKSRCSRLWLGNLTCVGSLTYFSSLQQSQKPSSQHLDDEHLQPSCVSKAGAAGLCTVMDARDNHEYDLEAVVLKLEATLTRVGTNNNYGSNVSGAHQTTMNEDYELTRKTIQSQRRRATARIIFWAALAGAERQRKLLNMQLLVNDTCMIPYA